MIEWKFKAQSALFTALMMASALSGVAASAARAQDAERQTPSGLPVPRYVSLKYNDANARSGPGDDHRLLWIYHVRGLPVQVVAETAADGVDVYAAMQQNDCMLSNSNPCGAPWPKV